MALYDPQFQTLHGNVHNKEIPTTLVNNNINLQRIENKEIRNNNLLSGNEDTAKLLRTLEGDDDDTIQEIEHIPSKKLAKQQPNQPPLLPDYNSIFSFLNSICEQIDKFQLQSYIPSKCSNLNMLKSCLLLKLVVLNKDLNFNRETIKSLLYSRNSNLKKSIFIAKGVLDPLEYNFMLNHYKYSLNNNIIGVFMDHDGKDYYVDYIPLIDLLIIYQSNYYYNKETLDFYGSYDYNLNCQNQSVHEFICQSKEKQIVSKEIIEKLRAIPTPNTNVIVDEEIYQEYGVNQMDELKLYVGNNKIANEYQNIRTFQWYNKVNLDKEDANFERIQPIKGAIAASVDKHNHVIGLKSIRHVLENRQIVNAPFDDNENLLFSTSNVNERLCLKKKYKSYQNK